VKEGRMPPRPGEEVASSVALNDVADIPIRVSIGDASYEMAPVEALALAGQITATVECWMRSKNG